MTELSENFPITPGVAIKDKGPDFQSQSSAQQVTETGGWKGLFKGFVKKTFGNSAALSQPAVEAVVNTAPSIPEVVAPQLSPIMRQLEDARNAKTTIPTEDSTRPGVAQAEITPPAIPTVETTPTPETTPWKPVFSQALMDSMAPKSPISGKTYAEIEQERVAAAAIARAASSDIDSIRAIATAEPGIAERAAAAATSAFRKITESRRPADAGEPPIPQIVLAERPKYDGPYDIDAITGERVQSVEILKEEAIAQQIKAAAITSGGIRLSDPAKEAAFNTRVKTSVDAASDAMQEIATKLRDANRAA